MNMEVQLALKTKSRRLNYRSGLPSLHGSLCLVTVDELPNELNLHLQFIHCPLGGRIQNYVNVNPSGINIYTGRRGYSVFSFNSRYTLCLSFTKHPTKHYEDTLRMLPAEYQGVSREILPMHTRQYRCFSREILPNRISRFCHDDLLCIVTSIVFHCR